jgi:pimeloyl-ACP methyl ester carboxylesterase
VRVAVREGRLFVDVLGPKLVPNGWEYRARPTVVLLHGGQGFADHTVFRAPGLPYERLGHDAQLVLVDLRGHGRSDRGQAQDWTLAGWADDVAALIDVLGLDKPVLLGESGGGFVALQVALTYPGIMGGLILASTTAHWSLTRVEAAFARRGGPEAGAAAVRFWTDPGGAGSAGDWRRLCLPLYAPQEGWPDELRRQPASATAPRDTMPERAPAGLDIEIFGQFALAGMQSFDFRPVLPTLDCPTLVIAGTEDPICPVEDSDDIAAAVPSHLLTYHRVHGAGHTVAACDPDRFHAAVLAFLQTLGPG